MTECENNVDETIDNSQAVLIEHIQHTSKTSYIYIMELQNNRCSFLTMEFRTDVSKQGHRIVERSCQDNFITQHDN